MTTKVADLSIEELKDIIREIIDEFLGPDGELNPDFAAELSDRMRSDNWMEHSKVWDES